MSLETLAAYPHLNLTLLAALLILGLAGIVLAFRLIGAKRDIGLLEARQGELQSALREEMALSRKESAEQSVSLRRELAESIGQLRLGHDQASKDIRQELTGTLTKIGQSNEQRQEMLRQAVENRLDQLRADNAQKLEEMRHTVDEKLQGTLEKRLGESFGLVSKQLEMVHKSVGEMQSLANGVGDLKRVLTNVKTRGTWGEIQLGNLLAEVLTPEQYASNVEIKPGSGRRVEFAICLPGRDEDGQRVYLPVDAKFPIEDYQKLREAAEQGDKQAEERAAKALEMRIRASAQDISQKYIHPPHSTDFALMFLPTEGLYAEVLRRPGLFESLQREHRITVAGPTTLAAILNSLQMGFRTLAIQKRSSEVWKVLGAVKTEFAKYGLVMDKVKKKLSEASNHIDQVGVRKRAIERHLSRVESLPDKDARTLLSLEQMESSPDDKAESE